MNPVGKTLLIHRKKNLIARMTGQYLFSKSSEFEKALSTRNLHTSCAYFKHLLKDDSKVLDVGCGPGSITASFQEVCLNGEVIGVERDIEILERARSKYPNVKFLQGEMGNLPFEDNTFDIVHANQVIQYVKDAGAGIGEMRRVCKEGGVVVMAAMSMGDSSFHYPPNEEWEQFVSMFRKSMEIYEGDPSAGIKLNQYCAEAGFKDIWIGVATKVTNTEKKLEEMTSFWVRELETGRTGEKFRKCGLMDDGSMKKMVVGMNKFSKEKGAISTTSSIQVIATK